MGNNNPMISYTQKNLASSSKDYQQHKYRKNLVLKCGFEEKNFTFFMEDHYLTIKKLLKFYENDKNILKNLKKVKNGKTDVYGCIYHTKNQFKFTNNFDYYNAILKLHLVKITDIHDDFPNLIKEITNNKYNEIKIIETNENKGNSTNTTTETNKTDKKNKNLRDKVKETAAEFGKSVAEELIDKSNIQKDYKQFLKDKIRQEGTLLGLKQGKLNEDKQYSDPILDDEENKFCINLLTSLDTKLTDSIQFIDRAKIIKTYQRILPHGSIWEFNLTHHFGKGVHLNYLFDLKQVNEEHPANYVFILEFMGDARVKLINRNNNDMFTGLSPARIHCEFYHKIGMLVEERDGENLEDGKPCVYRRKVKEEDFDEQSEFAQIFTPNREATFHVNIDEIELAEDTYGVTEENKKPYILSYNSVISPGTNLLKNIQQKFTNQGLSDEYITEDDAKFNTEKGPNDYEGTEGNSTEF